MRRLVNLELCPRCNMDSGRRAELDTGVPTYIVYCETCGYRTHKHKTMAHAVIEWNHPKGSGKNV